MGTCFDTMSETEEREKFTSRPNFDTSDQKVSNPKIGAWYDVITTNMTRKIIRQTPGKMTGKELMKYPGNKTSLIKAIPYENTNNQMYLLQIWIKNKRNEENVY